MTIRDIAIAFGYEVDKNSEKKANDSINKLKSTAGKILGALGVGFSLAQVNALIEQYGTINQQLKSATGHLANQKELQDSIMDSASNTLTSYETTAKAVSDYITQSKAVLKTSESAVQFTELATKAWRAAGREEAEIASLHSTLASAFQKNIIDASTFETILSQSPETIAYLEKSLGKTRTQLRAMAQAGVLTASHLTEAFTNSANEINAAYAEAPMKISDALKIAKEKIALVLTQSDEAMKFTKEISKMIIKGTDFLVNGLRKIMGWVEKLTTMLGGTENVIRLIGVIVAAVFGLKAITAVKKFGSVFKLLSTLMNPAYLKIALIIGAIVLLILIIEDIVAFCQGKNSLFGEMLKKSGMDVEATREQLVSAWEEIKSSFMSAFASVKETFAEVGKSLSAFWEKHGKKIITHLTIIVKWIVTSLATALKMIGNAVDFIASLLSGDFEGALEALKSFFKNWADGIGQYLVLIGEYFNNLFGGVIDKCKNWWTNFCNSVKEKIDNLKQWFADMKQSIQKKIEGVKKSVTSVFSSIVKWFKSNWKALLLLIINPFAGSLALLYKNNSKFKNAVDDLLSSVKSKFGDMKSSLKSKVSEWKNAIEEGFSNAKQWFEDLPEKALQWGKDMMDNFVDGIKDKFDWLEDIVEDIADLIDEYLGHSVPSAGPLKDDDKWMPDFMDNLAGGIRKNIPKLRTAVNGIVSELAVFANPEPSFVTQNMMQGSTSTRVINQNNTWHNNFNGGTRQEQADLANSSEQQVNQASSQLGTELAYTR